MISKTTASAGSPATLRLVLTALVLRVIVPVGLMPGAFADGWHLRFCPDDLPAAAAAATVGHDHIGHAERATEFVQCDLGGGLGAPFIPQDSSHPSENHRTTPSPHPGDALSEATATTWAFHSRGPPQSIPLEQRVS